MNKVSRRSFLKRACLLAGVFALNPIKVMAALPMASPAHVVPASTSVGFLEIDSFSEFYIKPSMSALANKIDQDMMGLYLNGK